MTEIIKTEDLKKEEIIRCFTDFSWRLTHLYYIVNEDNETILFKPNLIQQRILNERSDYRDLILKYRQGGVSTLYIIILLDEVLFGGININNVFITHRQDLLETFFQKARFTYESIPPKYKALLPKATTDNANELAFDKTPSGKILNNRLKIALDVRGKTPSRIHISEFGPMDKVKQVKLRLAIDSFRKTRITIESTADGVGDSFYFMCINARDGIGSYRLLFYPWQIEPRNSLALKPGECFMMDDYEKQLKETYNLTDEQLNWRRQKIHDANSLGEDGVSFFNQENPTTIESAFITSGASVFEASLGYKVVQPIKEVEKVKYFRPPGDKIIAGIDMAEGGIKGDFSTIVGYNIFGQVVFTYKGKVNETILALKVNSIYEQGYIFSLLPENNVGLAFINECKNYPWFIHMLKQRKDDKIEGEDNEVQKYGFRTSMKSKDLIIREYKGALYNKKIEVTEEIYAEIITYVYDKNNRPNAISPNHDDLLLASMIARHGILTETNPAEKPAEAKSLPGQRTEDLMKQYIENLGNKDLQNNEDLLHGYSEESYS